MAIIKAERLKYKYPLSETLALNDLNFTIEAGEMIGIIGANHSGKSTLCQAFLGLVPQFYKGGYGGTLTVNGQMASEVPIGEMAKQVGLVFQNPFTQMTGAKSTVFEEIAFGLEQFGIEQEVMKARIHETMALLDITHIQDKDMLGLSGGQMQRVAIAGVLAMNPEVIVMDEPCSQLDPEGTEAVFSAVKALTQLGKTVLMASHDMNRLAAYADRIMVLCEGRCVLFDTPSKVFSHPHLESWGIERPVVTDAAIALGIKNAENEYPATVETFMRAWQAKEGSRD